MTPISRPINSGPVVGNVPALAGSFGFAASEPAIAMTGIMKAKRPMAMAMPRP